MSPAARRQAEAQELAVLDELARDRRLSQRALAERVGMSVGFVNHCLAALIERGHVRVADRRVRPLAYRLTPAGHERRRGLRYEHYRSVLGSFHDAERRVRARLAELMATGARRVVFYGAGEVMELATTAARSLGLVVEAALDDDVQKHGTLRDGVIVHPPSAIGSLDTDAVVITTFRHAPVIEGRLNPASSSTCPVWHL
jgi:DNA-binding MarR family transcriptional regulator